MALSALSLFFFSSTCVPICSAISVLSGERCIHEVWREHVASLVGKWVALPSLLLVHHRYFSTTADATAVGLCRFVSILSTNTNTSRNTNRTLCATVGSLPTFSDILLPSLLVLVGHHEPTSYLWPPYSRCLFIGLLLFCPFPPVRLPTATLEPNNHLPKPKSLGPSVRTVRPFWFEITAPSSYNSLLPLD